MSAPVKADVLRILESNGLSKKEVHKLRRSKSAWSSNNHKDGVAVENAVVAKIAAATTIDLSAGGAAGRNLGFGGRKLPAWKLAAMSKI